MNKAMNQQQQSGNCYLLAQYLHCDFCFGCGNCVNFPVFWQNEQTFGKIGFIGFIREATANELKAVDIII